MTRKKAKIQLIIISFLIVLLGVSCVVKFPIADTDYDYNGFANIIKLGLDLKGGVYAVFAVTDENPEEAAVNGTVENLKTTLFKKGYTESTAVVQKDRLDKYQIRVEVPDVDDPEEIFNLIGKPALLEFKNPDDETQEAYVTGKYVTEASAAYDQNEPIVVIKFNDEGAEKFATATEERNGKALGIYINGELITSPTVQNVISNGQATITGVGTFAECEALALQIQSGSFSVSLGILENRTISPTLGDSAIKMSVIAGIVGVILIIALLIFLYKLFGVAASISLFAYIVFTVIALAILPWVQLTLSGIGGIILGIGMAVDANIVIFERIKDEYEKGKPIFAAVSIGFKVAGKTIIDSNVTTIIGALALLLFGPTSLQSFAITLMISIVLSFTTAMLLTKKIANIFLTLSSKKPSLYNLKRASEKQSQFKILIEKFKKFKITKQYKKWFAVPITIVSVAVIMFTVFSIVNKDPITGMNLGIDFTGGTVLTVNLNTIKDDVDITDDSSYEEVRKAVETIINDNGFRAGQFQRIEGNIFEVRYQNKSNEENDIIVNSVYEYFRDKYNVAETLPKANINTFFISPSSSVDLLLKALFAVAAALVMTLLYIAIRFKWRYGVAAVLTLVHDVLLLIAVSTILRLQINSSFIAAIVTIVGYSINNVIVVFDRIRENINYEENKMKYNPTSIADKSIFATITRSVYTTLTTLMTIVMLAILGGSSIQEFAVPIIIGLVLGLFSSLFVAPSIWSLFAVDELKKNTIKKQYEKDIIEEEEEVSVLKPAFVTPVGVAPDAPVAVSQKKVVKQPVNSKAPFKPYKKK